ncbi:MAG TPA: efflux RND transporter periplasmic adaptor subunit [Xanthobacteraceae bacterium]|jgi:multidrug efflux system membrane fusion protein
MKRLLFAAAFGALLAAGYHYSDTLGSFLFGSKPAGQNGPRPAAAQAVIAELAVETAAPVEVTAIGSVQSIATVVVKSRADGQISDVHFEEGQDVKEGDLLFTLDNRAFEAQLRQAQAQLERDRAQQERAQLELKRQSDLAVRGATPQQKLEDAQMAEKVYEAAMRADEAAIENARVNLSYTTIRSPIAGRTGMVNLKRGNVVKSNDTTTNAVPLVTITQMKPIYVSFTVPERHLSDIRAAFEKPERLPVAVAIPGQPGTIAGALTFIDNQVDAATGTIALKATFPNDDLRLWPGQFVNVKLTLGSQPNAVVVPSAATQVGQNGPYVFVVKPDLTVELRLVRIDRTLTERTVIASGLAAGERVVVDGQLRLSNGSRVTVQPSGSAPKAPPTPLAER